VTPEELAGLHPCLFHVTLAEAVDGIHRHGLLSTSRLLDLFEVEGCARATLERCRRPARHVLDHPRHGRLTLNDNTPLAEAALAKCLDDGLRPADWYARLNARVFFWVDEDRVARFVAARANRGRTLAVLVLDTLGVVRAHRERVELSAINSGAALRRPARRGNATFAPLGVHSYRAWQRLRGRRTPDRICEVVVEGGVAPIAPHLVAVQHRAGR
jgi:hypothetical protein